MGSIEIATLIAALNPDCVLIGGGAGPAALAALATVAPRASWFDAEVIAAVLGDDAGVMPPPPVSSPI